MQKQPEKLDSQMSELYQETMQKSLKRALKLQDTAIKGLEKIIKVFVGKDNRGRPPKIPRKEETMIIKPQEFLKAVDKLQSYFPMFNKNIEAESEEELNTVEDIDKELQRLNKRYGIN